MIRKLRAGMMPPPGARAPGRGDDHARSLTTRSKRGSIAAAALHPNPGLAAVPAAEPRRVRAAPCSDLLGTRRRRQRLPAAPTRSATASTTSPTSQALLADADGRLPARGQPDQPRSPSAIATRRRRRVTYKVPRTASQMRHVDGAPFGTRGGISVVHTFPADGDYIVPRRAARRADRRPLRQHRGDRQTSRSRSRSTASAWRCSTSTPDERGGQERPEARRRRRST